MYSPGLGKPRSDFFYYFEHRLRSLGHISVYNDYPWRQARENLSIFKQLLKILVDDSEKMSRKIDSWDMLKGFGGDKHYAKKLLFLYYPQDVVPIFKTEHLEHFVAQLDLVEAVEDECRRAYGQPIQNLTVGEKYEIYQNVLKKAFREVIKDREDSHALGVALYELYPPTKPVQPPASAARSRDVGEAIGETPILFEPVNELGVVMIFGMIHRQLGFPYIVRVRQGFPDAVVIDQDGEPRKIEFEYKASNFLQHKHDPSQCDFIICWEDDLGDNAPDPIKEKIIAIKDRLRDLL